MSEINLKNHIEKLLELEEEEEKYKNLFNNIKKKKENLNNEIMFYMEKNNITNKDIIYGNNKIKYTQTNVTDGITKKLINERLSVFLQDEKIALDATNFIYSDRSSSVKKQIKIIPQKK